MNKVIIRTKMNCATCGVVMSRRKTVRVHAGNRGEAIKEVNEQARNWKASLVHTNCKVCDSIING